MPKSTKKSKAIIPKSFFESDKDPIPPVWLPPPDGLGEKLLAALEYKPLEDKDLFGLKVSKRAIKHLSPSEIRDLGEVFQTFDREQTGLLQAKELKFALKCLGFSISLEVCEEFINSIAENSGNNGVNFNQFLDLIIDKQNTSKDHYEEILNVFKLFDYDCSNHISLDNLRKACQDADLHLSENELKEMIQEADQNGDGLVDQSEFIAVMLKTNLY